MFESVLPFIPGFKINFYLIGMEVKDIMGNIILPGDKVVWAEKTKSGNSSAWLMVGEVKYMKEIPQSIKVEIEVTHDGEGTYGKDPTMHKKYGGAGSRVTLIFGSQNVHNRIYKITDSNLY